MCKGPLINDDVELFDEEGGVLRFTNYNITNKSFKTEPYSQGQLVKNDPNTYTLTMPDGVQKIFSFLDTSVGSSRRVFLTKIIDNTGINSITFAYEPSQDIRLSTITDAVGYVTTFNYDPFRPFLITKIIDPFGRSAQFDYDIQGRLKKITDTIGLESIFTYEGNTDFIKKLTTPYGDTDFLFEESLTSIASADPEVLYRRLTITDAAGDKEVIEYTHLTDAQLNPIENDVPTGTGYINDYLNFRNVFYWDKKTMRDRPQRAYKDARIYHYVHIDLSETGGFLESVKYPLENRIWYTYPNQPQTTFMGDLKRPSSIAKVIDSGLTQRYIMEYNAAGLLTRSIDPQSREFLLTYDPVNKLNITGVYQMEYGNYVTLMEYEYDHTTGHF